MPDSVKLSDQLPLLTCRLETEEKDATGYGTGFIYSRTVDEKTAFPLLITNRHVVKNAINLQTWLHIEAKEGQSMDSFPVQIKNVQSWITYHSDPNVDLAAIRFAPILKQAYERGIKVKYTSLNETALLTKSDKEFLGAIENIVLIGYPVGLWDRHNNMPIIRSGITATHPNKDYEGRSEFMIDCACFVGSSGSPVILFNEGTYVEGRTVNVGSKIRFLGVLYSGPVHNDEGEIEIQPIPTGVTIPIRIKHMIHLGNVIKASKVIELVDQVFEATKTA